MSVSNLTKRNQKISLVTSFFCCELKAWDCSVSFSYRVGMSSRSHGVSGFVWRPRTNKVLSAHTVVSAGVKKRNLCSHESKCILRQNGNSC